MPRLRSATRLYSEGASAAPEQQQAQSKEESKHDKATEATPAAAAAATTEAAADAVPWYLRSSETYTQLNPALNEPIPEFPENAPESLKTLVTEMIRELGFTNVTFIDLRNRTPVSIFGADAILILATGNTERHIGRGTNGLITFIKHNFNVVPSQEGIQTSGFLKVQRRRLKKKAKKLANADETFSYSAEASRFANNWVVLDTKVDSLLVHMMTPEKREALDLEYVWAEDPALLEEQRRLQLEQEESAEADLDHQQNQQSSSSSPFSTQGSIRGYHTYTVNKRWFSSQAPRLNLTQASSSSNMPPVPNNNTQKALDIAAIKGDYKTAIALAQSSADQDSVLKAHINYLFSAQPALLTNESDVVKSFFSEFPKMPTKKDHRLRLQFLVKAHELNPSVFRLRALEEHLINQQASGLLVDIADVELVLSAIVSSKEYDSPDKTPFQISRKKSRVAYYMFKDVLRPQGTDLSYNIYQLLFRLWLDVPELSLAQALKNPAPARDETTGEVIVERVPVLTPQAVTLFKFLRTSPRRMNQSVIYLALTAFANDNRWSYFFNLWHTIDKNLAFDNELFTRVAALVVKSGNCDAMLTFFETILQKQLMANPFLLDKDLAAIVKEGLLVLDPSENGFKHIREAVSIASL
ncbi:hypothetical protein DV451_002302 [Geotrichum candidum]|uniref:ATPase synthesis protein 25 n=1 Tax=Geotrichum candidum TaxID=1173061 RepID=A0A9P5G565_GEOCN|nr:hypothetical protein DV451_002302 [Geotrichum candidum]KAF5110931.1 hypothetical protein DV453_000632 [Geotrichum candidum]KAF5118156.1 hypothetical protein DV454_000637 [Geotrichum candidum]KAI8136151.1 hypothetical protein DUD61_000307 [Geotrichum candidum]